LVACAAADPPDRDLVTDQSCGKCDGDSGDSTFYQDDGALAAPAGEKAWTVLVYFATHVNDATLRSAVQSDLGEMLSVGAGKYANVIVEYHRPGAGSQDGVDDVRLELPSGPASADASDPIAGWKVVSRLGDSDSGKPDTLSSFLSWGIKTYPAQRYAVILHGHGLAWQGFGLDEAHGSQITLAQVSSAFDLARTAALGGDRFDIVMFDACLMGTIEVAAEMQPHARYFLSSEDVEISAGQPYAEVLPFITRHPRMMTPHILANMAHAYVYGYSRAHGFDGQTPPTALTVVGLDLDKLGGLTEKVGQYADAVRRVTGGGLVSGQVKGLLTERQMAVADDQIHSADLYQVLAGTEVAPWVDDATRQAARDARDFIGYPRDGYNPAMRSVEVVAHRPGTVVFGLDGWSRKDDITGTQLMPAFEAAAFGATAPPGQLFPGINLTPDASHPGDFTITFHPFIPLVREFDWVVLDEGHAFAISSPSSVKRERDYYVTQSFASRSPDSPFVVEAHTQGYYLKNSQMVHGLGIFFGTILPDFTSYQAGRFAQASGWSCLFKTLAACPVP
jgi:hypothetical protein